MLTIVVTNLQGGRPLGIFVHESHMLTKLLGIAVVDCDLRVQPVLYFRSLTCFVNNLECNRARFLR
jgi:hypothetical protein